MPHFTYHVALAFTADADGELHVSDATEVPTPEAAVAYAKRLSVKARGAVAFSRMGDLDLGRYSDATIHVALGELPADVRTIVSRDI